MHTVFENAGEIDPRLIFTFGVNVKEGPDAIGFFGTGLKYALSILLRTGHEVTIQSGETVHAFSIQSDTIRGKSFDFVVMDGRPLGFTTEVGKSWDLWMAYRELFCNCQDEGGEVCGADELPAPLAGTTRVIVTGDDFAKVRAEHHRYFLTSAPVYECAAGNMHPGPGHGIYYRNVLVGCASGKTPTLFGYNIKGSLSLTEDRTVKHGHEVAARIAQIVVGCDDAAIVRAAVTAKEDFYEGDADLDWPGAVPSAAFLEVVGDLMRRDLASLNPTAKAIWERATATKGEPLRIVPDGLEQMMLDRATAFCRQFGFPVNDYEIVTVEGMGTGILGMARERRIYIARAAFDLGTKMLAGTLIEEFLHLRHGYPDCSRQMQECLLNRLVSVGERLQGEPL